MGSSGRGGRSSSSSAATGRAIGVTRPTWSGSGGGNGGGMGFGGAPSIPEKKKGVTKRRSAADTVERVRPILQSFSGRDRQLRPLLSSPSIRRAYDLIFKFLREAGTIKKLGNLLKSANTSADTSWAIDVEGWMKDEIESSAKESDQQSFTPIANSILEDVFPDLIPGGDLFKEDLSIDDVHAHCLKLKPNNIAVTFLSRLIFRLLEYYLDHKAGEFPEVSLKSHKQEFEAASKLIASQAHKLKPASVSNGHWFNHISENLDKYVAVITQDEESKKEASG